MVFNGDVMGFNDIYIYMYVCICIFLLIKIRNFGEINGKSSIFMMISYGDSWGKPWHL